MPRASKTAKKNKRITTGILLGFALFFIAGSALAYTITTPPEQVNITATVPSDIYATIIWAVPELRVGTPATNDDATFYLTVRTSSNADDVILYTQPNLLSTGNDGTYTTPIPLTVSAGTYDIGIKTQQHLTKILDDVALVSGTNVLNFTQLDNSSPKGTEILLAGDVNLAGTGPATLGDDVVNSVDLSATIMVIDDDDLTGNALRPNLNQDIVVNSVDLSILIKNLDVEGQN